MRDYGKVYSSFWSSRTIRSMTEHGRTLALYLLTNAHGSIAGVYHLPNGYALEDLNEALGWSSERVAEGFDELFEKGFAVRCPTTKWVWVVDHFEWNNLENPNQRKAARKVVDTVPDACIWKIDFLKKCGAVVGMTEEEIANGCETLSKGLPNLYLYLYLYQDLYQKQKQKAELRSDSVDKLGTDSAPAPKSDSVESAQTDGPESGEELDSRASDDPPPAAAKSCTSERRDRSGSDAEIAKLQGQMTEAGRMAKALREANVKVQSNHPTLMGWVQQRFTVERVLEAVAVARMTPGNETKPLAPNYIDTILQDEGRKPDAQRALVTHQQRESADLQKLKDRRAAIKLADFRDPLSGESASDYRKAQDDEWNRRQAAKVQSAVSTAAAAMGVRK